MYHKRHERKRSDSEVHNRMEDGGCVFTGSFCLPSLRERLTLDGYTNRKHRTPNLRRAVLSRDGDDHWMVNDACWAEGRILIGSAMKQYSTTSIDNDEIAPAGTVKSWQLRSQDGACRHEPEKEHQQWRGT